MLVNRSVRKFVALVLAGAAVAGVVEVASGAVSARPAAATKGNRAIGRCRRSCGRRGRRSWRR